MEALELVIGRVDECMILWITKAWNWRYFDYKARPQKKTKKRHLENV